MSRKIKSSIYFLLSYFLVCGQVIAQTASILPQGVSQFLDNNANPLTSGTINFYIPSTTTNKTTWQDAAETIPNANPVILDAAGRAKIYGSGSYRQVVKDKNGNLIYDAVTASAGGSGSSTTSTGDGDLVGTVKSWAGLIAPNQYAFMYGQEISRTTYSVLFTAITINQPVTCTSGSPVASNFSDTTQIPNGAVIESVCFAPGSTVVSKTSTTVTFNTNSAVSTVDAAARIFLYGNGNSSTTFNLPDLRGYTIAGRTNMGGAVSTALISTYFGSNPQSTGAKGGNQGGILTTPNLPAYTPSGTVIAAGNVTVSSFTPQGTISAPTITISGGTVGGTAGGAAAAAGGQDIVVNHTNINASASVPIFSGVGVFPTGSFSNSGSTFTGTAQGGTSSAFSIVQPTLTLNYIIKITPDQNSASASGVTSLGLMTGDIACGTGVTCSGNIISVAPYAGSITVVPTMVAMRALTAGGVTNITRTGYLSNGDSVVSNYYWAPAASCTDDGGACIQPNSGGVGRWLLIPPPGPVPMAIWGALCDGSALGDDTTALQAAINWAQGTVGNSALKLQGNCRITAGLVATGGTRAFLSIIGDGQNQTTIRVASCNTTAINFTPSINNSSLTLRSFVLVYPSAGGACSSGATAIILADATKDNSGSIIDDVGFFFSYAGVEINNGINFQFTNNYSQTASCNFGLWIHDTNASFTDSGGFTITGNQWITNGGPCATIGDVILWQASGGIVFANNKMTGQNVGLNVTMSGQTSEFQFMNNLLFGMNTAGISITRTGSNLEMTEFIVTGNIFDGTNRALYLPNDAFTPTNWMHNLIFNDNTISSKQSLASTNIVTIYQTTGFSIANNLFLCNGTCTGSRPIFTDASANHGQIVQSTNTEIGSWGAVDFINSATTTQVAVSGGQTKTCGGTIVVTNGVVTSC